MAGLGLLLIFGVMDQAVASQYRNNAARESEFRLDDVFANLCNPCCREMLLFFNYRSPSSRLMPRRIT